jgi:hypothetical protein
METFHVLTLESVARLGIMIGGVKMKIKQGKDKDVPVLNRLSTTS